MRRQLQDIFLKILKVVPDETFDTLSIVDVPMWDSLSHMSLIGAIEDVFCIELSMEEIVEMRDVPTILEVLARRVPE